MGRGDPAGVGMRPAWAGPTRSHGEIHILKCECEVGAREEPKPHEKEGDRETLLCCPVWVVGLWVQWVKAELAIRADPWFVVRPKVWRK